MFLIGRAPVVGLLLLALGTVAVRGGAGGALRAGHQPPEQTAVRLDALPLLFADDSGLAKRAGVTRTLHAARTHPAPVVESDRPWEGNRVYIYGTVHQDPESGLFRMWYMTRPLPESPGPRSGAIPELRAGGFDVVLYATSRDGILWEKPSVGLYQFNGSRNNNIVFDLHSPSILVDARETNPAKRYKMVGALEGSYHAAYSADGLRWTSVPGTPILPHSDTITLAQDPATGDYLAYHKRPATVRGHARRVVWLSRSPDFQTWSEPELVFAPDEQDDAWVKTSEERTEVYNMSVFPHASGFIGLPTIFRVMKQRARTEIAPGQSPVDGPIDVELATSMDGRAWQRPARREVMIPRGAPGTFDAGAILGVASAPVHVDNVTWVYYTALTTGHGAPMPPKRITIGRAEWRRHGFASLDAGPDGGRIETTLLQFGASSLVVNADASRGRIRVALLESDGRPIASYRLEDSEGLESDAAQWTASWKGQTTVPTEHPVRVVVELTSARLFSLSAGR